MRLNMKRLMILFIAAFSLISSAMYAQEFQAQSYQEIHTESLSQLVDSANPLIVIIDARDIKTDNGKRIPSAKVIPFDAPRHNITDNLLDKDAMIIVYCTNTQCTANKLLAKRLLELGYRNVWIYPEGVEGWEASGRKVEKGRTAAEAASDRGPKSA